MKKKFEFLSIIFISFVLAYGFNLFFLHLNEQTPRDQIALLFFSTASLAYILYYLWNERSNINFKISFAPINKQMLLENIAGILLALFFFSVYFYFGWWLNQLKIGQVDNLFDADISSWIHRISFEDVRDFVMRGPHPFTYFIFRPFGTILNLITQDPLLSATIFNSGAGSLCVFVTWLFIKRQFQSRVYAFLIAALIGLSTSHLFFSIAIETYIFSAFSLILFFLFLQTNSVSISSVVFASTLTFGITITNFVQNFIGFVIARPRFKEIFHFTAWVISISLLLSFLHAAVYPESRLFFLSSDAQKEEKFFVKIWNQPDWRLQGRVEYLMRTELLYTVIAPKVFILTDEVGSFFPEFRFFKISTSVFHQTNYESIGQILVSIWAFALLISGVIFVRNLIRTRKVDLSLAFLLCLLFNFVLHIFYGQELFLYSPDWAYALIFFVAFGLAPFSKNRLFLMGFMVFILLLAFNQWQFLQTIFGALVQFAELLP